MIWPPLGDSVVDIEAGRMTCHAAVPGSEAHSRSAMSWRDVPKCRKSQRGKRDRKREFSERSENPPEMLSVERREPARRTDIGIIRRVVSRPMAQEISR